jgi:predicted ATPase
MIRFLRLKNFKCFEFQELEFGSLTLLSGLNGMGKSSVLQALLLLRQSYQQELLQKTGLALNGDLVQIGTAQDALFEDAEEEIIGLELERINNTRGKWRFNYNKDADVLDLDRQHASIDEDVFQSSLFKDSFHYLQAERLGPRRFFEMSVYQVQQHRQIGTRGEFAAHLLDTYGAEKIVEASLAYPGTKSLKLRDQVEAWLEEISPGTRIHIDQHKAMDLVNLEYSFVTGKHVSSNFRSTNVGFGLTYTLPVLVALLASGPGSLIMIENPEAHLHPKGQVRIGELISIAANCGIQVIVESHSDHILNGIRLAVYNGKISSDKVKFHYFERKAVDQGMTSIVTPAIDQNGRIDQWPEGFFDVWDKCLEALLTPKK